MQYAVPGQARRYLLCTVYGGIALVALARNRRHVLPALAAPFPGAPDPGEESVLAPVRPLSPRPDRESAAGIQLTRILGGNDGVMTPPIPRSPGPATAVLAVPARTQVTAPGRPAVLAVPGRSLVLVAGLPGAGKTTLLRALGQDRAVRVSDSDPLRAAVLRLIPRGTRYGMVRPAVHLLHRSAVAALALGPAPVVVMHLPATSARLRRA